MSAWKTATIVSEDYQNLVENAITEFEPGDNFEKLNHNSIGLPGYDAPISNTVSNLLRDVGIEKCKVLIIEANDTTDSGDGTLYEVEKNSQSYQFNQIDEKIGYEGARAKDVTGYFRENHDINGVARIH